MVSDAERTNPFAPDQPPPSAAMDTNPLSSPDTSDDDAPAAAGVPAALASAPPASALPAPSLAPGAFPSTVLQTLDIRHHVPVTLDLHAGNYAQWSRFFLTIVGMFGVRDHLVAPAAPRRRDPEWVMVDHCVVHWLYATISPELLDAVMQPEDTAEVLWAAIESIFRDNNLSRAVYLDAEYHAVVQGDLTVMQYCTRLKTFADQLRDLGQPVSERQQLFNMLRGLGRQYHNAIPHLTSRVPLPTFLEARSFLLLEEHRAEQAVRQQSAHALIAARPPAGSPPPSPQSDGSAGRGRGRNRRRGRGNGGPPGHPPRLHLRLSWSELQHRASSATAAVGHGRPSDRASGRAHFLAVSHQHLGLVHGLRRLLAHDIKPRISAPAW